MPEAIRAYRGGEEGGHPLKRPIIRKKRDRLHELRQQRGEIVDEFLAPLEGPAVEVELRLENIEENPCDIRIG